MQCRSAPDDLEQRVIIYDSDTIRSNKTDGEQQAPPETGNGNEDVQGYVMQVRTDLLKP